MAETPTLALTLTFRTCKGHDGTPRGRLDVAVVADNPSVSYERTPTTMLWRDESPYADLTATAYFGSPDSCDGRAYGWEVQYRTYGNLDAAAVTSMATGFKQLARATAKLDAADGGPVTLGQYVVRLMRALKITRAYLKLPEGMTAAAYRDWRPLTMMESVRDAVDHHVEDFRTAHVVPAQRAAQAVELAAAD